MARFGQQFIRGLTSPEYSQGMFNLGSAIGSAPALAAEKEQQSKARQIINEAIASNDPTKIMQASQAVSTTMPEMSTKLAELAQKQTQTMEQSRLGRGLQGGLTAIQQAARRGIPLEQLKEAQNSVIGLGGTQEQIAEAYNTGRGGVMSASDRFKTVGNRIFDVQEQKYIEPSAAAETLTTSQLKDVATPESILEYVQTGDRNVLKPIAEEEEEAPASQIATQIAQADNVLTTVKEATGLAEEIFPVFYDLAKYAPGTDARALRGKIDTLKANLSFDRLQKMRDESKTGGALGQVSNIELNLLGSALAALDPASKDFAQQLKKVEESYRNFKATLLGQKPVSDKYIEDNGVLYYEDDDGNLYSLGEL